MIAQRVNKVKDVAKGVIRHPLSSREAVQVVLNEQRIGRLTIDRPHSPEFTTSLARKWASEWAQTGKITESCLFSVVGGGAGGIFYDNLRR